MIGSALRYCVLTAAISTAIFPSDVLSQRAGASPGRQVDRADANVSSVEGDVYLVMQNGDIKKAAANTVLLVQNTPALRVDLDSACAQISRYTRSLGTDSGVIDLAKTFAKQRLGPRADSLQLVLVTRAIESQHRTEILIDETVSRTQKALQAATVATSPTGMNAHYRFSGVKPGDYLLFAETTIGSLYYQWLGGFSVKAGEALAKDLDNSIAIQGQTFCIRR
jgi:hypothetical protein